MASGRYKLSNEHFLLTLHKSILFLCHELFNGAFSEMGYSLVIVLIKFP